MSSTDLAAQQLRDLLKVLPKTRSDARLRAYLLSAADTLERTQDMTLALAEIPGAAAAKIVTERDLQR